MRLNPFHDKKKERNEQKRKQMEKKINIKRLMS